MDASWASTFTRIFEEFGAKPNKAEKRARREVAEAISSDRAKRARNRKSPPLIPPSHHQLTSGVWQ